MIVEKITFNLVRKLFPVGTFHVRRTDIELKSSMHGVVKCLQNDKSWSVPGCIIQNDELIVIAILKGMNIECHFRFGSGILVRNTDLIRCIFDAQPMCKSKPRNIIVFIYLLVWYKARLSALFQIESLSWVYAFI